MTAEKFLLSAEDLIFLYGLYLDSINTIWNIYVFVLLGMVGWALARAHEFLPAQKVLMSFVFIAFNLVMLFYFHDAYIDIQRVQVDLIAIANADDFEISPQGITNSLINYDPMGRFKAVSVFISVFGIFGLFLVWSKAVWNFGTGRKAHE